MCEPQSNVTPNTSVTDRAEGDDVGARERDPEGADSDSPRRGAIVAAHVDQTAQSGDTIHRTVDLLDDTSYTFPAAHDREFRLLINSEADRSHRAREGRVHVRVWSENEDPCNFAEFIVGSRRLSRYHDFQKSFRKSRRDKTKKKQTNATVAISRNSQSLKF